jgi:outer membrane protein assembly factor BamB
MTRPDDRHLTRGELLTRGAAGALALAGLAAAGARGAAAGPSEHAAGSEWTTAARGLAGHRFVPGRVDGLHERWRRVVAGGMIGTPLISRGQVYAASVGGDIVAVDLLDGRVRWRTRFAPARYGSRHLGFFTGPVLAGDRLVVASDRVRCLDARTGRVVWTASPLRSGTEDDYFWGAPVVARGLVLVGSGAGSEKPSARGKVTAYRLSDGGVAWSTPMVPPGANGGGVIAQTTVDLARGSVWAATGSPYAAVAGPNPGTCSLVELSLSDGRVLWADQVYPHDTRGLDFNSSPLLLGRLAVAVNKDGVYAWDRIARKRLWHTRLTPASGSPGGKSDPTHGPEGGPLATDGRRLYATSNDGEKNQFTVAALEPRTGRVIWRRSLVGLSLAPPAAVGRSVVVATGFGTIFQLDGATGAGVENGTLAEPSACGPSSARGLVLVGTGAAPFLPGDSLICLGSELSGG